MEGMTDNSTIPNGQILPITTRIGPCYLRGGLRMRVSKCVGLAILCLAWCGCTSPRQWMHNGFKVGPNYCPPSAPTAPQWIDGADPRVHNEPPQDAAWWQVFRDPVLDELVQTAYRQNLPLKEAGCRILIARAQRNIAAGNLFPQQQQAFADYSRTASSKTVVSSSPNMPQYFDLWDGGFNLAWELDFWGRLRRAVESADDQLQASVEDYDAVLVLLVADVARSYAQSRMLQSQVQLARTNVKLQQETFDLTTTRFKNGVVSDLDVQQATANLAQTEALIPPLEVSLRQTSNQLCILLGVPPEDLEEKLGAAPIPTAPAEVAVGIPADLLRRRPDVQRAERQLAAQSEQIGIATAQLYPQLSIVGTIGVESSQFGDLGKSDSFTGGVGPSMRWDVLNYGRNLNRIRAQDAHFCELVWNYRNKVLMANEEVENGLAAFLFSQEQVRAQAKSVAALRKSVDLALVQYREGKVDFNRVFLLERDLVQQEIQLAQAQANVVLGLIEVYRALGGGWQIRLGEEMPTSDLASSPIPQELETIPPPPPAEPAKSVEE